MAFQTFFGSSRAQGCHVVLFSAQPAEQFVPPGDLDYSGRSLWIQVHRPSQRPWLIGDVYGHANDEVLRDAFIKRVCGFASATKEDAILLGDFNCEQDEGVVRTIIGNRILVSADECFEQVPAPTRVSRRRIDYILNSTNVYFTERMQFDGPADHDAVCYYTYSGKDELQQRGPPFFIKLERSSMV